MANVPPRTASVFLVVTLTLSILVLLVVACVVTLFVVTRTATEGFEDEVGFHRVKVPPTARVQEKRQAE